MEKVKKEMEKVSKEIEKERKKIEVVEQVEDITKNIFDKIESITHPKKKRSITFAQKAADILTKGAGSWGFILGFIAFLIIWIIVNTLMWINKWDPYPFILLNLVLSCLAAIQAPIILMSQNREAQKDRLRAEYDYQVNRKAEKQIQEITKQLNRIEKKLK